MAEDINFRVMVFKARRPNGTEKASYRLVEKKKLTKEKVGKHSL